MKRDDDPWQLDRLSAADAPELCRAVDAAKRQLPNASQLAVLAASLPLQGLPLPNNEGLGSALRAAPRFRMKWLVIGAGVIGATVLSVKVASPPVVDSQRTTPRAPAASSDRDLPSIGAGPMSVPGSRVAHAGKSTISPTPSRPEPVSNGDAEASRLPLAASGPALEAVTPNSPAPARAAPEPAIPTIPSVVGPRTSQSPSKPAQGSSLEAGSKVQPSELELLRDARLALRSSPALALGLTEQHSALYPRGKMAQERELIAISALAQLGRHAAVLSRAQRFAHDFPSSPYRKQIAQMAE